MIVSATSLTERSPNSNSDESRSWKIFFLGGGADGRDFRYFW